MNKEAVRPSESEKDLKIDVCSPKLEAEPTEALRLTVRPLKKEAERPIELLNDLNNEVFSAKLDVRPSEAPKDFARPLN